MNNDTQMAQMTALIAGLVAEVRALAGEVAASRHAEAQRYAALLAVAAPTAAVESGGAAPAVMVSDPVAAPAVTPFVDRWVATEGATSRGARYHPQLRANSQTYLTSCADPLTRTVLQIPRPQQLAWRDPPGWFATDEQHTTWLAEHGRAPADVGDTVVGPTPAA